MSHEPWVATYTPQRGVEVNSADPILNPRVIDHTLKTFGAAFNPSGQGVPAGLTIESAEFTLDETVYDASRNVSDVTMIVRVRVKGQLATEHTV